MRAPLYIIRFTMQIERRYIAAAIAGAGREAYATVWPIP